MNNRGDGRSKIDIFDILVLLMVIMVARVTNVQSNGGASRSARAQERERTGEKKNFKPSYLKL